MMRRSPFAIAFAAFALLAACDNSSSQQQAASNEPAAPQPGPDGSTLVYTVDSVALIKTNAPGNYSILVRGSVRTGGWSNARLKPLETFAREEGMMSFTLVATPPAPDTFVTQVITPVELTMIVDIPADVKTIRVMAETNEVSQPVPAQ